MGTEVAPPNLAHPDRKTIRCLFNQISSKYDFLNSFLSLGLESYWRHKAVRFALTGLERNILDLGAGTGKSLAVFLKEHSFEQAIGCDFSERMLEQARKRLGASVGLVVCDFHDLSFPEGTFDLVTGSFILRSVQDMGRFLSEVKRVLKPGGKAVFLELTRPKNPLIFKFFYQPYLQFYVPCMGKLVSRHDHAYEFLSQSVQKFVEPIVLRKNFESAGFSNLVLKSLSLGIVTLIHGTRAG